MFTQKNVWPESGDEGLCWVGKSHTKRIQLDKNLELGTRNLAQLTSIATPSVDAFEQIT